MIPKSSKIVAFIKKGSTVETLMESRQAIVAQKEENSELKGLFVVSSGVESAKDES